MSKRVLVLVGTVTLSVVALSSLIWLMSSPPPVAHADLARTPSDVTTNAGQAAAQGCVEVTSDIFISDTWAGPCYRIMTSTVTIQPGVVLTISPPVTGTRVEFMTGSQLQVWGNLYAQGAASRPITFTSVNTTSPQRCDWLGIILEDNSGGDLIQHSVIEYACIGIKINDEDTIDILSNTFRYNGGGGNTGAIGGDTDDTNIRNNRIHSCTNGIVLGEAFWNDILSNTIHDIDNYGLALVRDVGPGGSYNHISDNEIYNCGGDGLRLEQGYHNRAFSNTIYLNAGDAVHLSDQDRVSVRHSHIYSNGGGSGHQAAIYITGTDDATNDYPDISHNVIHDGFAEAIEYAASNSSPRPLMTLNALCSIPSYELQNSDTVTVTAPSNWWTTNAPAAGEHYAGQVGLTSPIILSLITSTANLPADGLSSAVVTVTLRDQLGNTVPPPPSRQTNPPAPNARRIELTTTLGSISPTVVVVSDDGVATTTLTSDRAPGTATVTATAFCDYAVAATAEITKTNVAIVKAATVAQVVGGDVLTYRISYSNTSDVPATNVVITDRLPVNLSYAGDNSGLPCPSCGLGATGLLTWTVDTLAPGANASFVLTARVSSDSAACGTSLTNVVAIGTAAAETNTTDNVASAGPTPVACADVAITKTTAITQVVPDGTVTYTVAYANDGDADAHDVALNDVLPPGTSWYSDTALVAGWTTRTVSPSYVTWFTPTLRAGAGGSFHVMLRVSEAVTCGTRLTNTVFITTTTPESTTVNNVAHSPPMTVVCPDLSITKSANPPQGPPSAQVNYTLVYTNDSDIQATNIVITDWLPANTSYLSDTSGLACPACLVGALGPLTWTVPSLPPHHTGSFTLTLNYTATACPATLVNTVAIHSAISETTTVNNWATATYRVLCDVDLVVVKDDDVGPTTLLNGPLQADRQAAVARLLQAAREGVPLAPTQHRDFVYEGNLVTYTIAVVNVGTYTATNVVLTERLPTHTHYVGIGWTQVNSRTFTQAIGTLPPGDGRVVYFIVRVHDLLPVGVNSLVNWVCGWSDEDDVYPDDNCNYEDTPVRRYRLRVTKTIDEDCVAPGDVFDYRITYQNTTTATTFTNVVLTDTLDTYVSYVGGPEWSCMGQTCKRTVLTIPPGGSGTLLLPVQLTTTLPYTLRTTITNVVEIQWGSRSVLVTPIDTGPDLSVVKNDDVGPLPLARRARWEAMARRLSSLRLLSPNVAQHREFVRPGERITYTILYLNDGFGSATGVVLTETLPEYTSYVGDGWTHTGGRQYTHQVGDLAPGQGSEVQFIVQVDDPFPPGIDRVINRVDVGGRMSECGLSNNWSADDTPVSTDRRLYVANRRSGTVDVFNTTDFDYIRTITMGVNPYGMAVHGNLLFVADFDEPASNGRLYVVDALSDTGIISVTEVGAHPVHVAAYDGYVYIASHSGPPPITVVRAEPPWDTVTEMYLNRHLTYEFGLFGATADEKRGCIYFTKPDFGSLGIWRLTPSSTTWELDYVYPMDEAPRSILYHPDTDQVYVAFGMLDELWVFDPESWELLDRISTGHQDSTYPGYGGHGLAALGQCVFVSNYLGESVTAVINGSCVERQGPGPVVPPSGPYTMYLPIVGRNFRSKGSIVTIPLSGRPEGMTGAGNLLFVTLSQEDRVAIINTETLAVVREISVPGDYPHTVILAGGN